MQWPKQPKRSLVNIVRRKCPWSLQKILDLCNKRRELRKKWFKPEGQASEEQHQEVHEKGKRKLDRRSVVRLKKNLRKNNSKRAYQLVKDLTTVKQRKATTVQNRSGNDRILLWAVQSQGQWRSISAELSPDRQRGRPTHPSQRSGGCSTITEEKEVWWSWQHPSRTGLSRWRGCSHRSRGNLQQDLADRRMANLVDQVLSHHTS